jgi:hypothetical protein
MSIIFGLDWKHPAVILNGIALVIDIFYVLIMILVLHIPDGLHPYYKTLGGGLTFSGVALWCISEPGKANMVVGYLLTGLNLFVSCVFVLVVISYRTGPDSLLWHMMH